MGVIYPTNSWFTDSHKNGVLIEIEIGELKLKVFQNDETIALNEIYSNKYNEENSTSQYVNLGGKIIPGTPVPLTLILTNQDSGSASMFVRYKFEVYIRGVSSDTKIEGVSITGYLAPTNEAGGFVKDGDYYYYRNNSGENTLFAKNEVETLMQYFTIPESAFVNNSGEMLLTYSDSLYIKLVIEGSTSNTFAV